MATQIDKPLLAKLRIDLDLALKAVGAKYGIDIKAGNARFLATSAEFKLNVNTISDGGVIVTKEADALKFYAPHYGITDEMLKSTFKVGHQTFKLIGFYTRKPVKPFQAVEVSTGKQYILTQIQVKHGLGIK
jgi:hypothetical protein